MTSALRRSTLLASIAAAALVASCDSSPSGPAGGPVTGAADEHCGAAGAITAQKVGMCLDPRAAADGGASDAGGDDGGTGVPEYGDPLFNAEGYDDDCKYHVSFTSTPVRKNENVTFTVTIASLDPAGPAKGADLEAEVFLNETTPAPNTGTTSQETPAESGIYEIGPIKFDQSGRWTVRFHMYDRCADEPADSPHGHAAFYIDVP